MINLKTKKLILFSFIPLLLFGVLIQPIYAAGLIPEPTGPEYECGIKYVDGKAEIKKCNRYTFDDFLRMIVIIVNWLWKMAGIVALIFAIVGGFLYITSAGNPGMLGKAKAALIGAIVGFIIAVASFLIVQTLLNFLEFEEPGTGPGEQPEEPEPISGDSVTITQPATSEVPRGVITLEARVRRDINTQTEYVKFFIGDGPGGDTDQMIAKIDYKSDGIYSVSWNNVSFSGGTHTITAWAYARDPNTGKLFEFQHSSKEIIISSF
ncbi:hypothetical protein COY23_00900 [bacterium (Candidatus Torokbacteria) CG_4_10_14_0_2_um_filter_35_8]|nr:MAG: hypothetical protein COY23_00900 [bacterium (Candidatus Torokbacteria) CG_4_10_14_0_2_um_filter_35_8]